MKISKRVLDTILGMPLATYENRQFGLSTGYALYAISNAMIHPNVDILVNEPGNTVEQNRTLLIKVVNLIRELDLDYFVVHNASISIRYSPFIEINYNGR